MATTSEPKLTPKVVGPLLHMDQGENPRSPDADRYYKIAEDESEGKIDGWVKRRTYDGLSWIAEEGDARIIEAPVPTTPTALYIFLHEVGHHELGHLHQAESECGNSKDEYEASMYAFHIMKKYDVPISTKLLGEAKWNIEHYIPKEKKHGCTIDPAVEKFISDPKSATNPWFFGKSKKEKEAESRPRLKSAWTLARAMSEAYKGGYKGNEHFRDWLKRNKLDDRSEKQIEMLGEKWGEGVVAEAEKGRKGTGGYKAPSARQRAQILRDTVSEYKEAKGDVDFDMLNPKRNNPGPGTGYWVEFESVKAAKQYARLMEGEGKRVLVWRDKVMVEDEENSTNPKTIDGYPVVKKESDAYALYDATDHEVIGYAPGHPWPLSKTKALREKGSGHKVYYVGFPVKENPAPRDANEDFKAGYRYYLSRYKTAKGSFTVAYAAEKYASKFGVRKMSGAYSNEATRTRIQRAQQAYEQFLDGTEAAHNDRIKAQHPDSEENPAQSAQRRNPESSAGDMYESFHGAPSQELVTYHDEEHYHEYLSELGVCCGLLVECADGTNQAIGLSGYEWAGKGKGKGQGFVEGQENPKRKKGPIGQSAEMLEDWAGQADSVLGKVLTGKNGKRRRSNPDTQPDPVSPDTTLLCSNEDGTQLYLQGGDQSLDLESLGITGDCATKELIVVGEVLMLYYETAKDFDKYEPIQYHHKLGEETGEVPILGYDRLNERLLFIGGEYKIEKPAFETSPGIEN